MKLKDLLSEIYLSICDLLNKIRIIEGKDYQESRLQADIIRYVHSIEKGLSIELPRPGFGVRKIHAMMDLIDEYIKKLYDMDHPSIYMAIDALDEYLTYHKANGYSNDDINQITSKLAKLQEAITPHSKKMGGTQKISKSDMSFDLNKIEELFLTRHSIREFSDEQIDNDRLNKAFLLAQNAPSACNRQGVRIYVIDKQRFLSDAGGWVNGIGGFSESVNKYVLITAKQSVYELHERCQYIVSASIYAAYLTLTLHALGIGSCIIQRPVTYTKRWRNLSEKYQIMDDEQIIMLLGVGMLKEITTVPISHRLPLDRIVKYIH